MAAAERRHNDLERLYDAEWDLSDRTQPNITVSIAKPDSGPPTSFPAVPRRWRKGLTLILSAIAAAGLILAAIREAFR